MKKKLLLVIALIIAIGLTFNYSEKLFKTEKSLKEKHAEFLKNHPYNKTLALTKKERKAKGMPPNKYFEQEYLLEMNPNTGKTNPENIIRLQKELKTLRKGERSPGDASDNMWVERGPNNIGGRTRVVMFDPNDATHKRVFAAGVSGGLWVNNDITSETSSWTRVGIDENLSVSCMTVDPNNSQIMYLGTGESYTGDQAVGNGVWKSIDGGATWTNVYSDSFNATLGQRLFYINDIIAWNNPSTNKTEVFIGVAGAYYGESAQFLGELKHGLYKSVDDGATFTWLSTTLPSIPGTTPGTYGSLYEPNDFEIAADNTLWLATESNIYGSGGGTILKSTDGSTFTIAHSYTNAKRTEIAVSATNKDKIYALYHISNAPKMEVTTNGFSTTTEITTPADADTGISDTDFTRGQSFYDLVIEVDPTDDTKIYAGGIDLFRSTDSGGSWTQISKWSNNNNLAAMNIPLVHADQHGWAFHPTDANKAIIGNDGGVYYASSLSASENTTTAIVARNKDYNVTQFYHGDIGQSTSNDILLAGAQDNGTPFVQNASAGVNNMQDVYGGDGAYSFIDKDGEYMIVSYVYNVKARFDLPYTCSGLTLDNDQSTGSFINPQELDDNLDILYANGNNSIIRYSGIKNGETLVETELTNLLLTKTITALKVSPFTTSSSKLYVGTNDGYILSVENANTSIPTWSFVGSGNISGSVSSIEFGANENEIMVTMHNYGVASVWYTTNGGTTWSSKEGNLPDIPVKAIMMNPLNNNEVIIGTGLGVWKTGNFKDTNPSWSQSYNGMSNVKVTSLSLRTTDNTVMATTYGRGMFTAQFLTGTSSVEEVLKGAKAFTMYPTVSNGNFTIFAKNTLGKSNLKMFDINGKEVYTKQLDFTQQERQSIKTNLNPGIYIVNLIDSNAKKATSKVVIK